LLARRRVDRALFAVVMHAYLHDVSTRKVDGLGRALGAESGISKSEASRICAGLNEEVSVFRDRDLSMPDFHYVPLDATYCKSQVNHRIVSQAVVVAIGVAAVGRRVVLGFDDGDAENEAFCTEFLRSLKTRGLTGVKLVMSGAHTGLKKAIGTVFQGASWQRSRVDFKRNVLSIVPKGSQKMVASMIRTIFVQPDKENVLTQFAEVTRIMTPSHPKVALMLEEAKPDVLAFTGFPHRRWPQIWSTNPLERVTRRSNDAPDL
jgi:putative transposase